MSRHWAYILPLTDGRARSCRACHQPPADWDKANARCRLPVVRPSFRQPLLPEASKPGNFRHTWWADIMSRYFFRCIKRIAKISRTNEQIFEQTLLAPYFKQKRHCLSVPASCIWPISPRDSASIIEGYRTCHLDRWSRQSHTFSIPIVKANEQT
mgnify:CR=1 FL=1